MKLLVREEGRDVVIGAIERSDAVATSRLSSVECRAALERARRAGRLEARGLSTARRRLLERFEELVVIEIDDTLAASAGDLCARHELRAADAIHLASALAIAGDVTEVAFACFDRRLSDAAGALGFELVPSD